MNVLKQIKLGGREYVLVRSREREGLSIYRGNGLYVRVAAKRIIDRELATHKTLASFGFSVPRLIEAGKLGVQSYFSEKSLGSSSFSTLFIQEVLREGCISDVTFEKFIGVMKKYSKAQLKTIQRNCDWRAFTKGVHRDVLLIEQPEYREQIMSLWKEAMQKLKSFPFVVSHGDLNPHNFYPKGIIDLETVFVAPAGYDIVTNISHIENFPVSTRYEYFRRYHFTPEQKYQYLYTFDACYEKAGLPSLSKNVPYFEFFRDIWSAVRMHRWPKIQKFRYERFVRKYLQ